MAKRSKAKSSDDIAEDDAWEDDNNATDTDTGLEGAERSASYGDTAYEVLVPGTVIDQVYYPKTDCEPGQEMIVMLSPEVAQGLANGGVALKEKETGEVVVAEVKEEEVAPEPEASA